MNFKEETNVFIFNLENFNNDEELMYKKLSEFVKLLLDSEYVCVINKEEFGTVSVEYNYNIYCNYGNATPHWLTPEDFEYILEKYEDDEETDENE